MKSRACAAVAAGLCVAAVSATAAQADVFNGRIAFSSFRTDPQGLLGDIFSMNPDGTDLRQLTDNPLDDAQSDWSPDGRDIAYRIRKPETPTVNFEVARMSASGTDHRRLTFTPEGQASSQPTWFPDKSAILFRWSAPRVSNIWQMGPLGENPVLRYDPTREAPVVSEPVARHEQGALRQHDLADRRHGPFDPDAECRRHRPHHTVRRGRVLRLGAGLVARRHEDRLRERRQPQRWQSGRRPGDLGHERRRLEPDPADPATRCGTRVPRGRPTGR